MRTVRFSQTALNELHTLLEQGLPFYSPDFLEFQRSRVFASIHLHLTEMPDMHAVNTTLGLRIHHIKKTPFFVGYDFDRNEVRIHTVRHRHARPRLSIVQAIRW